MLTEEEMNKVKVNWDELISCSTELLKYVGGGASVVGVLVHTTVGRGSPLACHSGGGASVLDLRAYHRERGRG